MTTNSYNIPSLLQQSSRDYYNKAIKKRKAFDVFMKKLHDVIIPDMQQLDNENYVVTGSRAWNNWYLDVKQYELENRVEVSKKDSLDKSGNSRDSEVSQGSPIDLPTGERITIKRNPAFLKGNWDIFIFCDETKVKDTVKNIHNMFKNLQEKLGERLSKLGKVAYHTGRTIHRGNGALQTPNNNILFNGYELALYFEPNDEDFDYTVNLDHVTPGNFVKYTPEYVPDYAKELIYCKIFPKKINLEPITNVKGNTRFLNSFGLLIFMELLRIQRAEKGLNIDKKRYDSILYTLNRIYSVERFTDIIRIYNHVFLPIGGEYYDKYLPNSLELLTLKVYKPQYEVYINEIEFWIVNKLRNYVNTFLVNIDEKLKQNFYNDAHIMLVGGDAIKRHIRESTRTSDYDAKLKCNKKIFKQIDNMLKKEMIKLMLLLNYERRYLFNKEIKYTDHSNVELSVQVGSFRLRKIDKSEIFPVTLYTIDYGYKLYTEGLSKPKVISIPLLDIVIEDQEKYRENRNVNDVVYMNRIPIASIQFLIKDIISTYTDNEKASQRFWNNKNKKDLHRYKLLNEVLLGIRKQTSVKYFDGTDVNDLNQLYENFYNALNDNSTKLGNKELGTEADRLLENYNKLITHNISNDIYKHKLPFLKQEEDSLLRE